MDKVIFPSKFIELDSIIFKDVAIGRSESLVVYRRTIIKNPFIYCSKDLMKKMIALSDCAKSIIGYIGLFLKYDTNIIEFTYRDFIYYKPCDKNTFTKAIEELEINNIIERYSGRYKIYGVNYKYLFYGSIDNFIKRYIEEYGNEDIKFDDYNRIILSNEIYNKYKIEQKLKINSCHEK